MAQADAAVKYSTSAVDVCCCFTQVGQLVIYTGRSAAVFTQVGLLQHHTGCFTPVGQLLLYTGRSAGDLHG